MINNGSTVENFILEDNDTASFVCEHGQQFSRIRGHARYSTCIASTAGISITGTFSSYLHFEDGSLPFRIDFKDSYGIFHVGPIKVMGWELCEANQSIASFMTYFSDDPQFMVRDETLSYPWDIRRNIFCGHVGKDLCIFFE